MRFIPAPKLLRRWVTVLFRYGFRLLRAAGRQQVMLSTMAIHTISGLTAMLQALLMGDRLVMEPRFHPVRVLQTVEKERVTVLIGAPIAYVAMMKTKDFAKHRLSSLLICGVGSAPCPPELAREIQRRFQCAVHIGFGMTELGGGIAAPGLDDPPERQAETVGRAMPGVEVRVVDDQRHPLPSGAIGELACRIPGRSQGYFLNPRGFDAVVDQEGWLYTGDLAVIDEDGYIRIVGRK